MVRGSTTLVAEPGSTRTDDDPTEEAMMGQPWTFRGSWDETEIEGVTYRQLYDIVRRQLDYFHPDRSDPDAFCQDMCCQVEKAQGIYPNVPDLVATSDE